MKIRIFFQLAIIFGLGNFIPLHADEAHDFASDGNEESSRYRQVQEKGGDVTKAPPFYTADDLVDPGEKKAKDKILLPAKAGEESKHLFKFSKSNPPQSGKTYTRPGFAYPKCTFTAEKGTNISADGFLLRFQSCESQNWVTNCIYEMRTPPGGAIVGTIALAVPVTFQHSGEALKRCFGAEAILYRLILTGSGPNSFQ